MFFLLFFVSLSYSYPSFLILYDLGLKDSYKLSKDLAELGPNMMGGVPINNGLKISEYKQWKPIDANYLELGCGYNAGNNDLTILTSFKPTACENLKFLTWIYQKDFINARCGLICHGDFEWKLACVDLMGRTQVSDSIRIPKNEVINIGISIYDKDGMFGMTLMWKVQSGKSNSYEFVSDTMAFNDFFKEVFLTYGSFEGDLYYFAALTESIDYSSFMK